MIAPSSSLGATLEAMRERARRLEQEATALRSDLDEMAIWLEWETRRAISPETLQQAAVTETEVADYQTRLGAQWDDSTLRLVLQAQKIATQLKHSVPAAERNAMVEAVTKALHQAASALHQTIPAELEAVIGD
jgi:hypothetical protein